MSDQSQKRPTRPSDLLEPVRAVKGISIAGTWTEYLVLFLRLMAVGSLVKGSGLTLVYGDPRELLGMQEFDVDRVVRLLPELLIGASYPVLTQTLVLEKHHGPFL